MTPILFLILGWLVLGAGIVWAMSASDKVRDPFLRETREDGPWPNLWTTTISYRRPEAVSSAAGDPDASQQKKPKNELPAIARQKRRSILTRAGRAVPPARSALVLNPRILR